MNLSKHIWEGWTVQDFIDELQPQFDQIRDNSYQFGTSFMNDAEIKKWCMDNQPYYKKHIPEVYNYFRQRAKL